MKKPKHHEFVEQIKTERKRQHKKDYRPSEEFPTVDEAKSLFSEYYKKRGFPVERIQNKGDRFLVIFGESKEYWAGSTTTKRGNGPYGLYSVDHSWFSVKKLKEQENARNQVQEKRTERRKTTKQTVRRRSA